MTSLPAYIKAWVSGAVELGGGGTGASGVTTEGPGVARSPNIVGQVPTRVPPI